MTDTPIDEARTRAALELEQLANDWESRAFDLGAGGEIQDDLRTFWRDAARRFFENKLAVASVIVLGLFVLLSIVVPMVSDANCCAQDFDQDNLGVSLAHPFGTDPWGRDLWLMSWQGGRVSLSVAFAVSFVILIVGTIYGAISGYVGGRIDTLMMRFLDALYGLPYLPFAIIFVGVLRSMLVEENRPEPNPLLYIVPALSITAWFTSARIVRAQVMTLKQLDYVGAARSMGARWWRVLGRHIIVNSIGIFVVSIALEIPNAIIGEASLSFLGVGVQSHASWGRLANEGYRWFQTEPHLIVVPGALIAITVLATTAIADALRDALDPRETQR